LIALKRAIRTSSLITVAEVHGDAFGFGLGLAMVCDFALVASQVSLCFPEMRTGLPPAAIMAYLGEYALPRFAFPLVLFGEPFSPQRALDIGLISQVCPAESLSSEADALVTRILKLNPDATRRCKQFFLAAQNNSYEKNCSLAIEALTQGTLAALGRKK
jgi:enoyl-CoA hydratase/carnithine racemase